MRFKQPDAPSNRQLLGGVWSISTCIHELAAIIAGEDALASKIEIHALKALAVYDALVRRITRVHFSAFDSISSR
jgi:hypothetical protein